jgi:DNA-directed RNA polymerase specialized sigma24 family protein
MSYDEIASSLGVPAKTVKSRLYSARQRLAVLLAGRT